MQQPIMVGTVLYEAFFERGAYGPFRVEAIGADWIVVRGVENGKVYFKADTDRDDYTPGTTLRHLAKYTVKPSDEADEPEGYVWPNGGRPQ